MSEVKDSQKSNVADLGQYFVEEVEARWRKRLENPERYRDQLIADLRKNPAESAGNSRTTKAERRAERAV
jgi:hypothetical protein